MGYIYVANIHVYICIYIYIYTYISTGRRELGHPSAPDLEAVGAPRSRRDTGAAIEASALKASYNSTELKAACTSTELQAACTSTKMQVPLLPL